MPDSVPGMGALLTLPEASSLLRLKTSTLRAWVLRRKIPYVKVGRLVRLRRADVEALIVASVVPALETAEVRHEPSATNR
jgi:excisionase family DNA binding protein